MTYKAHSFRVGIAALTLATVFIGAPPASAAADPHVTPIDPLSIDDPRAVMDMYRAPVAQARAIDAPENARCGSAAADPVPDGQPIVVSMPPAPLFTVGAIDPASWQNPPVADPTWQMNYQGLMWMKPLARRAAQDGQTQSLEALIDQAVAFHKENPDPNQNLYGWDEGTALRRLETENCLYSLTNSEKLIPGMEAEAAVLFGWRYYGPPNYSVHNHGLMANLQLVRAAELLDRPEWKTAATNRMVNEAPLSFSSIGTSWEQSSMYQLVNANLWEQAANVLEQTPGSESAVASIRATVNNAKAVYAWMTEPDGDIVQVGDSDQIEGVRRDWASRTLRDDQAGWVVGRWAWTDPETSYYTVRYGPKLRGHGHHDRAGGVTWSTRGVRVLVGPGRFSYDKTNNYNAYQVSDNGQNVAIPDGGTAGTGAASVLSAVVQAPAHAWNIQDSVYGTTHNRNINVNRDVPHMQVTDTFPNETLWRQSWHLDPEWVHVSGEANGTQLVFSHPSGRTLTITTTGRVSSYIKGQTRPPAGWHFPEFGSRLHAYEIVIRSYGGACSTKFVVS